MADKEHRLRDRSTTSGADTSDVGLQTQAEIRPLLEHLFRTESTKLVAVLSRRFGLPRLGVVEDIVQDTLIAAMHDWSHHGVPDNPAAWLTTVAKNKALNLIKHEQTKERLHGLYRPGHEDFTADDQTPGSLLNSDVEDSQLRMIFACCHLDVARSDQLALVLKVLCGFGVKEVARALLLSEDAAAKRLYRARQAVQSGRIKLEIPGGKDLSPRLDAVCHALYLLFNEGYASASADRSIRRDLCAEAMRLVSLLVTRFPERPAVTALLSLFELHTARFDSRLDGDGEWILLEDQDRSRWDKGMIQLGLDHLFKSATGDVLSRYHLEATIAAQHCLASDLTTTNWALIEVCYRKLDEIQPSPIVKLNLAIVKAKTGKTDEALSDLQALTDDKRLSRYALLYATLAEVNRERGELDVAQHHLDTALQLTDSPADKTLLSRRLQALKDTQKGPRD